MSKTRLLSFLAIVMLLCNLALMLFCWKKDPSVRQDRGEGPRQEIIKRLQFDQQQVDRYDEMVSAHRSMMRQKENELRLLKQALYSTLNKELPQTVQDSLIGRIADTQKEIEYINLAHFSDIGTLCTPKQKPAYHMLVSELAELFMRRPPPPHHH